MIAATNHWLFGAVRYTAALVLLAGCLDRRGGQSGTEDNDSSICIDSELLHPAPEDVPPGFQQPLREIATTFAVNDLPWVWLSTGERTTLSIELLTDCATARARSNQSWCGPSLESDVRVRSADGVLDARVRALLEPEYHLLVPIAELPAAVMGPAVWPPDVQNARQWLDDEFANEHGDALTLYVAYMQDLSAFDVEAVLSRSFRSPQVVGASTQGDFSRVSGPPFPFTPDSVLASACDGAQQFWAVQSGGNTYTSRANAAEALSSLVGTWARCLDSLPSSHAGLQVLPDGSWRDFTVEGGELVARSGFQHEGLVQVIDAHPANYPGGYQLGFLPFGRRADGQLIDSDTFTPSWDPALVFRSEVAEWPPAIYRRTTLPVRAAAPEYAEGERAGADACSRIEQGFVPSPEVSLLSGDFVLCSGALSGGAERLHFDGSNVELQRADGSLVGHRSLALTTRDSTSLLFTLSDENASHDAWTVMASRRPLKLRIEDYVGSAVFSALP